MNRRLSQFIQAENITQTQLADTLGVARGGVSNILSGRNKPGFDFMESLLLHYPSLNIDWLITGRGKMYRDSESQPAVSPSSAPIMPNLFQEEAEEKPAAAPKTEKKSAGNRTVSKILVLYSDNTYQDFSPV